MLPGRIRFVSCPAFLWNTTAVPGKTDICGFATFFRQFFSKNYKSMKIFTVFF